MSHGRALRLIFRAVRNGNYRNVRHAGIVGEDVRFEVGAVTVNVFRGRSIHVSPWFDENTCISISGRRAKKLARLVGETPDHETARLAWQSVEEAARGGAKPPTAGPVPSGKKEQ